MSKQQARKTAISPRKLESYFKVGVSADYILVREDFPIYAVPPGEFKALILRMFRKNDRVMSHAK
ncbi:MAG: hypothetical protein A4E58_02112 [Syntrophorhabdus sp. PtaB.Bin006]|nr:MAG: hypothetical protein A4E58_02112 [Syntrophorhabdus sp. PtaB.Bin006]OPY77795.1 MAG: hypothetical protein A4E65_02589 [Syntrophorhabdus sp. PtaU1.Bin153]